MWINVGLNTDLNVENGMKTNNAINFCLHNITMQMKKTASSRDEIHEENCLFRTIKEMKKF
jgi:hypothetical protein